MEEEDKDLLCIGEYEAEFQKNDKVEKIIRLNMSSKKDSQKWIDEYKMGTNTGLIVSDPMSSSPQR